MLEVQDDGATRRAHLEASAARGNRTAQAALAGPDYPDAMQYLLEWTRELVGRSGGTLGGLAPLSYGTIATWAALTGRTPSPRDVEALLELDAAMRPVPRKE